MTVVQLWNRYRTTEAETVIVAPLARTQQMTMPVISKRRAGVEAFVDKVVVNAAVILIGARLHREVKKAAASLAELRRVVAGLNRNLLDRFDTRLVSGGGRHSGSRRTRGAGS